jgi:hypothetical protein
MQVRKSAKEKEEAQKREQEEREKLRDIEMKKARYRIKDKYKNFSNFYKIF